MTATARRTSDLLDDLANGDSFIPFDRLLTGFGHRTFGLLLLVVTLPCFIPLPLGVGAISGPLVSLLGLQLLATMQRPWLPGFIRRRGLKRETYGRFLARVRPWFMRLERICQPRWVDIAEGTLAKMLTGALLAILGVLLSLPIPFTNYPFGILLILFSMALIERDGALMLIAWLLGAAAIAGFGFASGELMQQIGRFFS